MSNRKSGAAPRPDPDTAAFAGDDLWRFLGHPFRWGWALLGRNKPVYLLGIFINLVCAVLVFIPATVSGMIVNEVFGANDQTHLATYITMLVAFPCARAALSLLYRFIFERCSQDCVLRLRAGMYQHLQGLDMSFYSATPTGEIMAKATGDIDMVRHFLAWTFFFAIEQTVIFVGGSIYLLTVNWILCLVVLCLSPVVAFVAMKMGKAVRPQWSIIRHNFENLNTVVQQNIAGNRVVKAFVRADFETERFERENQEYRRSNENISDTWRKYLPFLDGLANFLSVLVILVGGLLVIFGRMSLGELVTFNGLVWILNNPMRNMGNIINELQRFAASAEKIVELQMKEKKIVSASPACPARPAQGKPGKVEFCNVSFNYDERSRIDAVHGLTFTAEPGQTIGIVGATGSGKSTLVSLIPRFFDASSGEVRIDGRNVREYDLQELRRRIGMVMQEVFLFSDTVEGNIAYGVPDLPEEEVRHFAQIASADDFIEKMPDGYDTIVGERGVGLSGGQRQRISLARALATSPDILILDDTTSALDMETEREIQNNIQAHCGERTTFIIAHRISSVRHADLILCLKDGEIVERGTHEQLIRQKGIYCDYFLTQAGLSELPPELDGPPAGPAPAAEGGAQ